MKQQIQQQSLFEPLPAPTPPPVQPAAQEPEPVVTWEASLALFFSGGK